MKTVKQLLRQPIKTVVGITIVTLAFAILVTCVGQYTATDLTRENLDDRYDTIALLTDEAFWGPNLFGEIKRQSNLPEETQQWIDETVQNRTDLVKTMSSTGLISAYIPELTIDNFSRYENGYYMGRYNYGYPYRCAMLTVTLTKIGTFEQGNSIIALVDGEKKSFPKDITILCVGTVESEVGLEKGFAPVVGKTIVLQITVPDREAFDKLNLQVGQTYLVYGEDFNNGDREEFIKQIVLNVAGYEEMFGKLAHMLAMPLLPVYEPTLEQFDCILTLRDPASLSALIQTVDEDGNPTGFAQTDLFEVHYWDEDALFRKWITYDEYAPYYQLPTIMPLNGSVDDFLASEEGALWQEALDKMEINNHGFPVLCVDKLGYQPVFSREQARIVEGRDFTESELANGEKVCIISQSVATRSGVQVGDTVELRAYGYDPSFELQRQDLLLGGEFPSAALYSEAVGFTSEMETYTIVGLYRQEDAWENQYDNYGFTPNTIFVPKSSVTAEMQIRDKGIYSTLVLQNGKMEEFKALLAEDDHSNWFVCYDQGYSAFMASLDAYEEVSEKALYIGLAGFSAVMLLFLFLYPVQQKRSLALMGSLGASAWVRCGHTFFSTLCILVPGAVLGGFVGSKLWEQIAAALMEWINIEIALESDMTAIAPKLTAASLAVVAFVALLVSAALCRNRGMMKRK